MENFQGTQWGFRWPGKMRLLLWAPQTDDMLAGWQILIIKGKQLLLHNGAQRSMPVIQAILWGTS